MGRHFLPTGWFSSSIIGKLYPSRVFLKGSVRPDAINIATRRQYWSQYDGASHHVTAPCLEFLVAKFNDRVLSRNIEHL